MPGTADARFIIRTASGDKGPFSREQIARFVEGGKLPPTAKILDVEAQRAVTAAEAIAPTEEPADPAAEAAPTPAAIDGEAATPPAPGVRAHPTTRTRKRTTGRETAADGKRGRTGAYARGGRKPKSRWRGLIILLVVVVVVLAVGGVVALQSMKTDRFKDQAATLLGEALAHPDAVAPASGSPGDAFIRILIKRDHDQALASAKAARGTYEGYKPAYDVARYHEALRAAIAAQVATPDSALLASSAKQIVLADNATLADVGVAKKIAQQAVTMDQEKSHVSLDALAWTLFKSGDAKRAALIAEQAAAIAPDTASRVECEKALRIFRGGKVEEP